MLGFLMTDIASRCLDQTAVEWKINWLWKQKKLKGKFGQFC